MIIVAIADDQEMVRNGIRMILEGNPACRCPGSQFDWPMVAWLRAGAVPAAGAAPFT
jgi:DNA-binding NarL/FixJ family response regulator